MPEQVDHVTQSPVFPDYRGPCVSGIVPALLDHLDGQDASLPIWIASRVGDARQAVVLVIDGLGWEQLAARRRLAPTLASLRGGPITTVAPSTTSTALTSIATGTAPAEHGVLGYRVLIDGDNVLNILRWQLTDGSDASERVKPAELQLVSPFRGRPVPVVTRSEFAGTGFTALYLSGARQIGYMASSSLPFDVRDALHQGEPLVVAYYATLDTVAHQHGFGERYDAELAAVDRLVAAVASMLPAGCVMLVTADHGQVDVVEPPIVIPDEVLAGVRVMSGEGRFRWLHAVPGASDELLDACQALYSDVAWVKSRDEVVDEGWFGGSLPEGRESMIGDVAVIARAPVAFHDPNDVGKLALRCRHGSLTSAEMLVPLLAFRVD
jgi:predicted AlkP superfamily pyrophosphatase or phosphodiesterase